MKCKMNTIGTTVAFLFILMSNLSGQFVNSAYDFSEIVGQNGRKKSDFLIMRDRLLELEKSQSSSAVLIEIYELLLDVEINLFSPTKDVIAVWMKLHQLDEYTACHVFQESIELRDNLTKLLPVSEFFIREHNTFFNSCKKCCYSMEGKWQQLLESGLATMVAGEYLTEEYLAEFYSALGDLDEYPGRSLVGLDYEAAAITIIGHDDPRKLKAYLPMISKAVQNGDLNPKYEFVALERYHCAVGNFDLSWRLGIVQDDAAVWSKQDLEIVNRNRFECAMAPYGSNVNFRQYLLYEY